MYSSRCRQPAGEAMACSEPQMVPRISDQTRLGSRPLVVRESMCAKKLNRQRGQREHDAPRKEDFVRDEAVGRQLLGRGGRHEVDGVVVGEDVELAADRTDVGRHAEAADRLALLDRPTAGARLQTVRALEQREQARPGREDRPA